MTDQQPLGSKKYMLRTIDVVQVRAADLPEVEAYLNRKHLGPLILRLPRGSRGVVSSAVGLSKSAARFRSSHDALIDWHEVFETFTGDGAEAMAHQYDYGSDGQKISDMFDSNPNDTVVGIRWLDDLASSGEEILDLFAFIRAVDLVEVQIPSRPTTATLTRLEKEDPA